MWMATILIVLSRTLIYMFTWGITSNDIVTIIFLTRAVILSLNIPKVTVTYYFLNVKVQKS